MIYLVAVLRYRGTGGVWRGALGQQCTHERHAYRGTAGVWRGPLGQHPQHAAPTRRAAAHVAVLQRFFPLPPMSQHLELLSRSTPADPLALPTGFLCSSRCCLWPLHQCSTARYPDIEIFHNFQDYLSDVIEQSRRDCSALPLVPCLFSSIKLQTLWRCGEPQHRPSDPRICI